MGDEFAVSFALYPDKGISLEEVAEVVRPFLLRDDNVSTQFGFKVYAVFDSVTSIVEFYNVDLMVDERSDAYDLRAVLMKAFPELYVPTPSQDKPDDEDWHGMYTRAGGEAVERIVALAIALMSGGSVGDLERALAFVVAARDVVSRTHSEVNDTEPRAWISGRLEEAALAYGFTATLYVELLQRVG